ncbi:G5 domain-containing protein [Luteimicrobium sp. DT211]|uniref:aggregation-promoting factor C-terminal-like domain-containing protein n=1 Tax=Luteimicrobium sp. DT211 TaxID=3393412 RepID=UPI003CEA1340
MTSPRPHSEPTSPLDTRTERHHAERKNRLRRRLVVAGATIGGLAVVGGIAVAQASSLGGTPADAAAASPSSSSTATLDRGTHAATRDLTNGRTPLTGTPIAKTKNATTSTALPAGAVHVVAPSWKVRTTATSAATVGKVLAAQHVAADKDDKIVLTPPTKAQKKYGFVATVTVRKVAVTTKTSKKASAAHTIVKKDSSRLASSGTKVQRAGKNGVRTTVQRVTTIDGKVVKRATVKTTDSAVDRILVKGTKADPKPAGPSGAKAIAASMVAARGWGSDQYQCLVNLWNRESGWSVTATNASSGAYGIPQSLPASKLASAGSDWRTSARTQIAWGLNYIAGSYGTPCGAWGHSQATGWY